MRINNLRLLTLIFGLVFAAASETVLADENRSWVNLCRDHEIVSSSPIRHSYLNPEGGTVVMSVDKEQLSDCDNIALPVTDRRRSVTSHR